MADSHANEATSVRQLRVQRLRDRIELGGRSANSAKRQLDELLRENDFIANTQGEDEGRSM